MEQYIKSTERVGAPYWYVDQKKHSVRQNGFPENEYSAEFNNVYCDTLNIKDDTIKINDEDIKDVIEDIAKDVSKDVYSQTETKIGTWIDGNPIYRQVQYIGDVSSETSGTAIANLKGLVHLWGVAYSPQYSQWYNIPNVHSSFSSYYVAVLLNNQMKPTVRLGSSFTQLKYVSVIIEYTKTTDG